MSSTMNFTSDLGMSGPIDHILGFGMDAKQTMRLLLALSLGGVIIARFLMSSKVAAKFPLINPSNGFEFVGLQRRTHFNENSEELIRRGRAEHPGKPFNLMSDGGEITLLPARLANDIRNNANLDFMETIAEDFNATLPGFHTFGAGEGGPDLVKLVVRKQLTKSLNKVTKPLSDETSYALKMHFGESTEWRNFTAYEEILDVVARVSSRVFLGQELCRNDKWLDITKSYTINAMTAATGLRVYPVWMRSILHWFDPRCKEVRRQATLAAELIDDIHKKREETRKQAVAVGKTPPRFEDALDWFDDEGAGCSFSMSSVQLSLSMAAIHTTSDLLVKTLFRLAQDPVLVKEMREEIVAVLGASGWQKTSLFSMQLVDSVLKETQRLEPPGLNTMTRKAKADVVLPTGEVIPKGARVCIDYDSRMDPEVFPDPLRFDGHRFMEWRGSDKDSLSHLVATGPNSLAFGHGMHACPGRFFAANESKVLLCHILMKYDLELPAGASPDALVYGFEITPNPVGELRFRKRAEMELDIDAIEG